MTRWLLAELQYANPPSAQRNSSFLLLVGHLLQGPAKSSDSCHFVWVWKIALLSASYVTNSGLTACSISSNITAGLIIAIGDRLSRKKDVLEKRMHQALTAEAIHRKHLEQKLTTRHNNEPGQSHPSERSTPLIKCDS